MTATTPTRPSLLDRARRRRATRRAERERVEAEATAQVRADEAELASTRRRHVTMAEAWRVFWRHPSPWVIGATLLASTVARLVVGGYSWVDLALPAVMVASFPVVEWLVHVFVLHARPLEVGRFTYDSQLARYHRAHHRDPRDLPLVFIPFASLLVILGVQVAGAFWLAPRPGLALTWLLALSAIGMVYEWTHHLIHSDYRPVSAAYRSVWRNHRLHHYKNERYWFTVTTAGTADRLLGTYPDPADVATSPTARDLLGAR